MRPRPPRFPPLPRARRCCRLPVLAVPPLSDRADLRRRPPRTPATAGPSQLIAPLAERQGHFWRCSQDPHSASPIRPTHHCQSRVAGPSSPNSSRLPRPRERPHLPELQHLYRRLALFRRFGHLNRVALDQAFPPFEALAPLDQCEQFVPSEELVRKVLVAFTVFRLYVEEAGAGIGVKGAESGGAVVADGPFVRPAAIGPSRRR